MAGVQGLVLTWQATCPPAPCTQLGLKSVPVGLSPLWRKLKTCPSVSGSNHHHLHLPPWPSCLCCPPLALLRSGRWSFPQLFHHFARSVPTSAESPQLSFPFAPLTAIYYSAVFRGGMQPVPEKGLLPSGISRLSLVPGSAGDHLCDTNQKIKFLSTSVSLCR